MRRKRKSPINLNIGAGKTYVPGFINIDISPRADVVVDLNTKKLPFKTSSVDLIFSYHCLEHIDDYLFALGEIHRVLKNGGVLLLGVPYVTLTEYNLVNPYHKQNFNEYSFDFFDKDKLKKSAVEDNEIYFSKIFHRFHYLPEWQNKPDKEKDFARRHYFNVVQKIDFGLKAVKNNSSKSLNGTVVPEKLKKEFDKILSSRIKYE